MRINYYPVKAEAINEKNTPQINYPNAASKPKAVAAITLAIVANNNVKIHRIKKLTFLHRGTIFYQ